MGVERERESYLMARKVERFFKVFYNKVGVAEVELDSVIMPYRKIGIKEGVVLRGEIIEPGVVARGLPAFIAVEVDLADTE